jgi:hypothetical protein
MSRTAEETKRIKERKIANDKIYTPEPLVRKCLKFVPFEDGDMVLDAARGGGVFYNNFPDNVHKDWCEIDDGRDYLLYQGQVDWVVTNPPFSVLNSWFRKTCDVAEKGFAFIQTLHSITPKRLEYLRSRGLELNFIHIVKVHNWYGMTVFCIYTRGGKGLFSFDRTVWK